MAEAVGTLRANLEADWADFRTELERSVGALGQFGTKFAAVAAEAGRWGLRIAGVAAAAGIAFAGMSLRAASEAEGVRDAFNEAFGESADSVARWAAEVNDSLRLSETAIFRQATAFQNILGEIAPTEEAAARLSVGLVRLANDFAALKNIQPERAVELFQQAIAGNTRGLRAYGVTINETEVQVEALRLGIIRQGQTLSAEQAGLVRTSLLFRELGDAEGAAAANADTAQGAQQSLTQAIDEAKEALGQGLVPAFAAAQRGIAGFISGLTNAFVAAREFIASSTDLIPRLIQIGLAMRGQVHSIEEVRAAYQSVRSEQAAAESASADLRGSTDELSAGFGDLSTEAAGYASQLDNARQTGRTWAQEHASDIQRLRELINPAREALAQFNEQSVIAARAGLDVAAAQRAMARQMIESLQATGEFKEIIGELPPVFAEVAEEIRAGELAEETQHLRDELKEFANQLNEDFDGESAVRREVEHITEAFEAGLISLEVYKEALREATGEREAEEALAEKLRDLAEERDREWSNLSKTIGDVVTGTRDLEDAWKDLVLQFIRAQMIEPFLSRLFQGGQSGGGLIGGIFSGGSGLGGLLGGLFGGKRAGGGPVMPGMAYEVGERGKEWFIPDEAGTILPNGVAGGTTIIQNIQANDVDSFRRSRRQIGRDARRAFAMQ